MKHCPTSLLWVSLGRRICQFGTNSSIQNDGPHATGHNKLAMTRRTSTIFDALQQRQDLDYDDLAPTTFAPFILGCTGEIQLADRRQPTLLSLVAVVVVSPIVVVGASHSRRAPRPPGMSLLPGAIVFTLYDHFCPFCATNSTNLLILARVSTNIKIVREISIISHHHHHHHHPSE